MVGREGFEPPKSKTKDLQSSPFDRSGTDPQKKSSETWELWTFGWKISRIPKFIPKLQYWSHQSDLNWWPSVYKTDALPTELWWHVGRLYKNYPVCQNFLWLFLFLVLYIEYFPTSEENLVLFSILTLSYDYHSCCYRLIQTLWRSDYRIWETPRKKHSPQTNQANFSHQSRIYKSKGNVSDYWNP